MSSAELVDLSATQASLLRYEAHKSANFTVGLKVKFLAAAEVIHALDAVNGEACDCNPTRLHNLSKLHAHALRAFSPKSLEFKLACHILRDFINKIPDENMRWIAPELARAMGADTSLNRLRKEIKDVKARQSKFRRTLD